MPAPCATRRVGRSGAGFGRSWACGVSLIELRRRRPKIRRAGDWGIGEMGVRGPSSSGVRRPASGVRPRRWRARARARARQRARVGPRPRPRPRPRQRARVGPRPRPRPRLRRRLPVRLRWGFSRLEGLDAVQRRAQVSARERRRDSTGVSGSHPRSVRLARAPTMDSLRARQRATGGGAGRGSARVSGDPQKQTERSAVPLFRESREDAPARPCPPRPPRHPGGSITSPCATASLPPRATIRMNDGSVVLHSPPDEPPERTSWRPPPLHRQPR